jgi:hypothetical protein
VDDTSIFSKLSDAFCLECAVTDLVIAHDFHRHFRNCVPWESILVSSEADSPPQRKDSTVVNHCTVTSDLSHVSKAMFKRRWRNCRRFYTAEYQLLMSLKGNNIKFELSFSGQTFGVKDVTFDEL